jgi:hypothetical protein
MAGLDPATQHGRGSDQRFFFGAGTRARWVAALNAAMVIFGDAEI